MEERERRFKVFPSSDLEYRNTGFTETAQIFMRFCLYTKPAFSLNSKM